MINSYIQPPVLFQSVWSPLNSTQHQTTLQLRFLVQFLRLSHALFEMFSRWRIVSPVTENSTNGLISTFVNRPTQQEMEKYAT